MPLVCFVRTTKRLLWPTVHPEGKVRFYKLRPAWWPPVPWVQTPVLFSSFVDQSSPKSVFMCGSDRSLQLCFLLLSGYTHDQVAKSPKLIKLWFFGGRQTLGGVAAKFLTEFCKFGSQWNTWQSLVTIDRASSEISRRKKRRKKRKADRNVSSKIQWMNEWMNSGRLSEHSSQVDITITFAKMHLASVYRHDMPNMWTICSGAKCIMAQPNCGVNDPRSPWSVNLLLGGGAFVTGWSTVS